MNTRIPLVVAAFGFMLLSFCKTTQEPLFSKPAHFPEPVYKLPENPLTPEGVALGKTLFYDALLSKDNTVSCGSCHQQSAGFTQHGHALSHGINDLLTKRNSMPLFNLAWAPDFGWDGGVHHLDLFPISPLQNPAEMDESLPNVLEKLRYSKTYPALFEKAFGTDEINTERFLKALSQFMMTMVSADARYDKWARKEGETLTPDEQAGMALVEQKCTPCHSGVLFSDFTFRNNGLPQAVNTDQGRYDITLLAEDRYKFKVPSLRNLAYTAPYMHDGRLATLDQVLDHYAAGVEKSPTLDPLLAKNGAMGIALTTDEKVKIKAFLNTLNDESFIRNPRFSESGAEPTPELAQYANTDWTKVDLRTDSPALKAALNKALGYYWGIKQGLLTEDGKLASQSAKFLLNLLENIDLSTVTPLQKAFYLKVYQDLGFDTEHISETHSVGHQRDHFGDLSKNLFRLIHSFQITDQALYTFFCPKAANGLGGYWLSQTPTEKGNPFFGKNDKKCGGIVSETPQWKP